MLLALGPEAGTGSWERLTGQRLEPGGGGWGQVGTPGGSAGPEGLNCAQLAVPTQPLVSCEGAQVSGLSLSRTKPQPSLSGAVPSSWLSWNPTDWLRLRGEAPGAGPLGSCLTPLSSPLHGESQEAVLGPRGLRPA